MQIGCDHFKTEPPTLTEWGESFVKHTKQIDGTEVISEETNTEYQIQNVADLLQGSMEYKCCQSDLCTEADFNGFSEDVSEQSSSALMEIHFLLILLLSIIAKILS